MSDSNDIAAAKPQRTFFSFAAWASLVMPLAALAITIAIITLLNSTSLLPPMSRSSRGHIYACALLADFGGFILGFASLFGIKRHGVAFILWKAIPGILASGILVFGNFVIWMLSGIEC